ncbi:hypothetical protein ABW20_dc0110673 [Dactylellina cionopaga]|nr:hypothetical protein ABW20_dc0110673 [Dactylellina cionopaga]
MAALNRLTIDVLRDIFDYLSPNDLYKLGLVCKYLYNAANPVIELGGMVKLTANNSQPFRFLRKLLSDESFAAKVTHLEIFWGDNLYDYATTTGENAWTQLELEKLRELQNLYGTWKRLVLTDPKGKPIYSPEPFANAETDIEPFVDPESVRDRGMSIEPFTHADYPESESFGDVEMEQPSGPEPLADIETSIRPSIEIKSIIEPFGDVETSIKPFADALNQHENASIIEPELVSQVDYSAAFGDYGDYIERCKVAIETLLLPDALLVPIIHLLPNLQELDLGAPKRYSVSQIGHPENYGTTYIEEYIWFMMEDSLNPDIRDPRQLMNACAAGLAKLKSFSIRGAIGKTYENALYFETMIPTFFLPSIESIFLSRVCGHLYGMEKRISKVKRVYLDRFKMTSDEILIMLKGFEALEIFHVHLLEYHHVSSNALCLQDIKDKLLAMEILEEALVTAGKRVNSWEYKKSTGYDVTIGSLAVDDSLRSTGKPCRICSLDGFHHYENLG